MLCPSCQKAETKVIDSRNDGRVVRRRRQCLKCSDRFTTYERIERRRLLVIKKDQRREPFSREKILVGIQKACQKRPVSLAKIEEIVTQIERELYQKGGEEVESKEIGRLVMEELKKLDSVAYIRFASVYRAFKDVKTFEKELKKLEREGK